MAEPLTGAALALAIGAAVADAASLVQVVDSYVSLADPAEGCKLEAEPFVLRLPPPATPQAPTDKNKTLRPAVASPSTPDKSKSLRPEGHSKSANTPSSLPQRVDQQIWLLSLIPQGGEGAVVEISLATMAGPAVAACFPYVSKLSGFDSRIGHQAAIKCKVVSTVEHAALLATQVLFNPLLSESGLVTIWQLVRFGSDQRVYVKELKHVSVPEGAFDIDVWTQSAVTVRPAS